MIFIITQDLGMFEGTRCPVRTVVEVTGRIFRGKYGYLALDRSVFETEVCYWHPEMPRGRCKSKRHSRELYPRIHLAICEEAERIADRVEVLIENQYLDNNRRSGRYAEVVNEAGETIQHIGRRMHYPRDLELSQEESLRTI